MFIPLRTHIHTDAGMHKYMLSDKHINTETNKLDRSAVKSQTNF